MTEEEGKWRCWLCSFFLVLYLCILPAFHPFFFIFSVCLSFPSLCPFPSLTSSWDLSLSRPSPFPHSPFHSFPTINLWLSKPVVGSGGLAPVWKRDERLALFYHRGVRVNLFSRFFFFFFFLCHLIRTVWTDSLCLSNDSVLYFLAAVAKWLNKKDLLKLHWTKARQLSHWLWRSLGVSVHTHTHSDMLTQTHTLLWIVSTLHSFPLFLHCTNYILLP